MTHESPVGVVPPSKLLLTVDEAAQVLSLGRTVFYRLIMRKQVFSVKVGGLRRVPFAALQAFVEKQMGQEEE
jgi:excisionase family DNA binding protein